MPYHSIFNLIISNAASRRRHAARDAARPTALHTSASRIRTIIIRGSSVTAASTSFTGGFQIELFVVVRYFCPLLLLLLLLHHLPSAPAPATIHNHREADVQEQKRETTYISYNVLALATGGVILPDQESLIFRAPTRSGFGPSTPGSRTKQRR